MRFIETPLCSVGFLSIQSTHFLLDNKKVASYSDVHVMHI